MPVKDSKLLIQEVEKALFFFYLVTNYSVILMLTAGYWRVKCIIPPSVNKVRKYAHLLQYIDAKD